MTNSIWPSRALSKRERLFLFARKIMTAQSDSAKEPHARVTMPPFQIPPAAPFATWPGAAEEALAMVPGHPAATRRENHKSRGR